MNRREPWKTSGLEFDDGEVDLFTGDAFGGIFELLLERALQQMEEVGGGLADFLLAFERSEMPLQTPLELVQKLRGNRPQQGLFLRLILRQRPPELLYAA